MTADMFCTRCGESVAPDEDNPTELVGTGDTGIGMYICDFWHTHDQHGPVGVDHTLGDLDLTDAYRDDDCPLGCYVDSDGQWTYPKHARNLPSFATTKGA